MKRSWWLKFIGIKLLAALAFLYLLPTFIDVSSMPGWYQRIFGQKINLGLDLQGGIHLVYEVEVDKAASDKADRLAADIEDRLKKEKKINSKVKRFGRDGLELRLDNASDIDTIDMKFVRSLGQNIEETSRDKQTGVIKFSLDEAYINETQQYAVRQAVETIRGRIDQFGVAEPTIIPKGKDIVVELPGLSEDSFERVKKQIGRTAQLEFKIVDDENTFLQQNVAKIDQSGDVKIKYDSFDGKQRGVISYAYLESSSLPAIKAEIAKLPVPDDHIFVVGEDAKTDKDGNPLPDAVWRSYYVKKRTVLTGEYITDAQVQYGDRTGKPEVSLTFDRTGARIFERLSGDNIGRRMAIVLDEKVNSAPVLESKIGGGRARITLGGMMDPMKVQNDAADLAAVLRTGALPAPLKKTFERSVGPTLGKESVRNGALALGIGGLLVVLFILYYYRGAGLICNIALLLNVLLILGFMAFTGATLTLPGIAGLVLTIGMAVDANVIIYERIREELRLGKNPRSAVDSAYNRAFRTILDAQLTTAIAAIVLWQYGSGPIRGFAITLLVGIICSMLTGVYVTRIIFDFFLEKRRPKTLSI